MQTPKILIVEDEILTSDHLVRVLRRLGYEVAGVAASFDTAAELIAQTRPDLLLTDIGLESEADGIQVAARARDEWNIPTVFLTAYSDPETLRRARVTEPYGYVIKPFVEQELHATIEIALQQKALRAQQEHKASLTARSLIRTQEELSAVTAQLFHAQEQERAAIARDLHDDIGQRLALLQLDMENLWQKLPPDVQQQHKPEFSDALRSAAELSQVVRVVSHRLHPAALKDLGLVVALRQLAEDFEESHLIRTRFSARGVPRELDSELSVSLYRIAQEALRNIGKHAAPDLVNIALIGAVATVELSVRDNGKGFDPQKVGGPRGLGLIGMVERASALGGKIIIDSGPGHGAHIYVSLPFKPLVENHMGSAQQPA